MDAALPPRHTWLWLPALATVALVKATTSTAGLVVGSWSGRVFGWVFFADVMVFSAAGLCLLLAGARDRRAIWLGCVFLLVATGYADSLLVGAAHGSPAWSAWLIGLTRLQPVAFAAFFFWLFVREFPRRRPGWHRGVLADTWTGVAFSVGVLLAAANLLLLLPAPAESVAALGRAFARTARRGAFWPVLFLVGLPALPYALLRARRAAPDERRRVAILLAGLALGVTPVVAEALTAAISPRFGRFASSPTGMVAVGVLAHPALLAIPVITAYAVLAHRALDVRLIIRKALQYALARTTIVAVMLVPFGAALVLLYLRRGESVQAVLSGGTGLLLATVVLTGVAVWHLRGRLLATLDRRFYREQYDAQRILSALVARSGSLRDAAEVATVVTAEIDRALHLDGVEMLLLDPERVALTSPLGGARPLPLTSRLARELGSAAGPVAVDWAHPDPWLGVLDADELGWLMETATHLIVPIPGADGWPMGALLLGEKRSELPFSGEDRLLLQAVAGSAALALQQRSPEANGRGQAVTCARECPDCGLVADAAATACARCGARTEAAAVPALIAGKLRPLERIGRGGMGVVYRALDLALDREVAVKALPRLSPVTAALLRREARAMAAVSDPNLGTIHGIETWNGAPLLVVELLPGGTLADRLTHGPLPPSEVLVLGRALAGALARLHAVGILHRDVKPSNIGFAADGTPKLLDFGVARVLPRAESEAAPAPPARGEPGEPGLRTRTGDLVGTLTYLSPESVRGEPPDPGVDLWALCMVMYEALAGVHPFTGLSTYMLLHRIATADVPNPATRIPGLPEPVASFLSDALHRDARRRPRTASELCQRLTYIRVEDEVLQPERKEVLR